MRSRTLFYVGQLYHGGTCAARAKALEKAGFELVRFDVTPFYQHSSRLVRILGSRLLVGSAIDGLNRDLRAALAAEGRVDVLWIDKGTWIYPETLEFARYAGVQTVVHYTPDPAFHVHHSRHFRACVPRYDICVTTKRYELELYRKAGARKVVFTYQGVDERFQRIEACSKIKCNSRTGMIFVGHHERYYEDQLRVVAGSGLPLRVYGPRWPRKTARDPVLAPAVKGDAVVGDAYAATLATGAIGIGLLCKKYPDAFTTRTFEIPAAGALLLAEDTAEHREIFLEGREAEFFSSAAELVDKARFYLKHEASRAEIARCGRERVMREFTWERVLSPVVEALHEREALRA